MRIAVEDAERFAKYREEIKHRFDFDYFNRSALMAKRLHVDKWLFDDIKVEGLENIEAVKDKQLFYVSNHKSLADFLIQQYTLWRNNLPIPRTIAGANLFKFPFKNFWKKCGAISLDRQIKGSLYLLAFYEEIKESLLSGESLLDYAEGTRNRGEGVKKFQTGIIHIVLDIAKMEKNIYAVPSFVDYDNIIEKDALKTVDMWKAKRDFHSDKKEKLRAKIYDNLCFYSDYLAYIPRVFSKNKGNAYLKFGKAFPIKDFDKKSLVEKLQREIGDLGNQKI
jgi:glycerol-3-phosphate O-acyltransferase